VTARPRPVGSRVRVVPSPLESKLERHPRRESVGVPVASVLQPGENRLLGLAVGTGRPHSWPDERAGCPLLLVRPGLRGPPVPGRAQDTQALSSRRQENPPTIAPGAGPCLTPETFERIHTASASARSGVPRARSVFGCGGPSGWEGLAPRHRISWGPRRLGGPGPPPRTNGQESSGSCSLW